MMMLALSVAAIGLFLAAAATDIAHRRIPNPLVAALAVLGLARIAWTMAIGAAAVTPFADLAAALAIFAAGALFFHFSLIGGGDVKLLAAGALWLGAASVWPFLMATALAGGALAALFLVYAAVIRRFTGLSTRPSLPYGVAIAAGGILSTAAGL